MKLKEKLFPPPPVTDEIPEKIHKRLHLIYFFLKCMAGVMVFLVFWLYVPMLLGIVDSDIPDTNTAESPFLRHDYCGTFFVEINAENSFASQDTYADYMEREPAAQAPVTPLRTALKITGFALEGVMSVLCLLRKKLREKLPENAYRYTVLGLLFAGSWLVSQNFMSAMGIMLITLLFLAFRSGDRKTIFCERSSDYFLIGGLLWLAGNIYMDIDGYRNMYHATAEGLTGPFSHPEYYCQLYNIALIPLILFCGGLILRRHELDLHHADTSRNTMLLKGTGIALLGGSLFFILWRMGVRVYELIRVLHGDAYNVKLAFTVMDWSYNRLIELPQALANTPEDYRNVVVFRFVKDFPVAVIAAAAVFCFTRVLFAVAHGKINTSRNRKQLNIAMLFLLAASLWFNLMGFAELPLYDNGFSGVFGDVTYTIATRSLTEPALYALALWFFKTYLQTVPEK